MTGEEARAAIKDAGLTVGAVAEHLEMHRNGVAKWWRLERMTRRNQYALERAIQVLSVRRDGAPVSDK